MGEPAGWYRDPAPANPGMPTTLRFWDGRGWTTRLKAASKAQRRQWEAEDAAAWYAAAAAAPAPPVDGVLSTSRRCTPDGVPLGGWLRRWVAVVVDAVLTSVAGLAFGWFLVRELGERLGVLAAEAVRTGVDPTTAELVDALLAPYLGLLGVLWLVRTTYHLLFLKGFSATPGKMLVGLEVRMRERPGVLSWGTVLGRFFSVEVTRTLFMVPLVNLVAGLYWLLDHLWPLWDPNRQALHDKLVRTSVVRTR